MIRRDAIQEYARGSLWVLPTLFVVVALVLGATLSQIDVGPESPLAFQGTADDARAVLIGVSSTMVTVIALLLGLAVVALQLSSTQFSPRLLRNFLRDRPNQLVLSAFVGTFAYSAGGLFTVGISRGERVNEYPRFAVSVAIALLFISLALLVYFADHLAHSIQVDSIMRVVERNTLPVIRSEMFTGRRSVPTAPPWATPIPATDSGYVQAVEVRRLRGAAITHRVIVRLVPRVGDHVVAGTPIAHAWRRSADDAPPDATLFTTVVDGAVRVGFERTLEQDPGFGLRQLCDVACKALSPAVNDPYTAIQAIHHLSVLFCSFAVRPVGDHVEVDPAGRPVVVIPARSFEGHLALGVSLIRRYGSKEPTVIQALLRLLTACATVCRDDPERFAAMEKQAQLLVTAAEREIPEASDLAIVYEDASAFRRALAARRAGQRGIGEQTGDVPTPPSQ